MIKRVVILWAFILSISFSAWTKDYSFVNIPDMDWWSYFHQLAEASSEIGGCDGLSITQVNNPEQPAFQFQGQGLKPFILKLNPSPFVFGIASAHPLDPKDPISDEDPDSTSWLADLFYLHEPISVIPSGEYQDVERYLTIYMYGTNFKGVRIETSTQTVVISQTGEITPSGEVTTTTWQCPPSLPQLDEMNGFVGKALRERLKEVKSETRKPKSGVLKKDLPPTPYES